jgi:hypothetical protein
MGVSKVGRPCAGTNWRRNLGQQSAGTCGPFQHQINSIKILYILIYIYIMFHEVVADQNFGTLLNIEVDGKWMWISSNVAS